MIHLEVIIIRASCLTIQILHMNFVSYCKKYGFLSAAAILAACSYDTIALDSAQHESMIRQDVATFSEGSARGDDKKDLFFQETPLKVSLSLDQAIDRALNTNVDARVAMMEVAVRERDFTLAQLLALPNVEGSLTHSARNNAGASRSVSLLSGTQSLEPSVSSEEVTQRGELRASWNLLDAALAFYGATAAAEETQMAQERLRLVRQNIINDVHGAYLRAFVAQERARQVEKAVAATDEQIKNLKQARQEGLVGVQQLSQQLSGFVSGKSSIRESLRSFDAAQIELRSLLAYAPGVQIELSSVPDIMQAQFNEVMHSDHEALELEALRSRADLREEWLNRNASVRELRSEFYRTLPGLEILESYNYDNNRFLEDPNWFNFSAVIAQNITRVFTLPWRFQGAKADLAVVEARRHALSAAVIAQLHIAKERFENAWADHQTAKERLMISKERHFAFNRQKEQGLATGHDVVMAQIEYQRDALQERNAQIELQDSYVTFLSTVGRDVITSRQEGYPLQARAHDRPKATGEET